MISLLICEYTQDIYDSDSLYIRLFRYSLWLSMSLASKRTAVTRQYRGIQVTAAMPSLVITHRLGALQGGHTARRSPLPPSSLPVSSTRKEDFSKPFRTSRYCLPPPEATLYHHLVLVREGRKNGYENIWVRDVWNPQVTTKPKDKTE
jgi:hypothetical protein